MLKNLSPTDKNIFYKYLIYTIQKIRLSMRSMKILLDIDDTSLIYNKEIKQCEEHPQLRRLIEEHTVILYSGNPDIKMYAKKWKANGYILKAEDKIPKADILHYNNHRRLLLPE